MAYLRPAISRGAIFSLSLLTISACSQDVSDLQTFIAQTKSAHVGSVKPIPQFKPYESFSYSAAELRDPFVANVDLEKMKRLNPVYSILTQVARNNHWKFSL